MRKPIQPKLKGLAIVLGASMLVACNGGTSSSDGGNTPPNPGPGPKPTSDKITVPLSAQVGTPLSIYDKSATKSVQLAKSLTADSSCFVLVETNGKNYTSEFSSSQWWSTSKVSFSIKNTCNTPQSLKDVKVAINGYAINGTPVSQLGDVSQSGDGPYMSVKASTNSVVINTPSCEGNYCDWAQLASGKTKTFNVNGSLGGPITSLTVQSVVLDGVAPTPPEPDPTPDPVDKTGEFTLKVNAADLKDACGKSTVNCQAVVSIGVPSGQSALDKITFNPAESQVIERTYANLLPGNYTLQVSNANLPEGTSYDYGTSTGTVNVAAGSKQNAYVNFKYSAVAELSDVSFSISGLGADLSKFSQISSISADIINEKTGYVSKINIPLVNGAAEILKSLPTKDSYTIRTQSIANPQDGLFYKGVDLKGVKFVKGANTEAITLTKVSTSPKTIKFNVTGLDDSTLTLPVLLADSGEINPDFYVYTPSNIKNGDTLKFVDGTVALNVTTPSGYTLGDYTKVVNSSTTINLAFTKNIAPTVSKVNATYWSLWGNNTSYSLPGDAQGSHPSVAVDAPNIDMSYNLIIASFIVTDSKGNYVLATSDPGSQTPQAPYYSDAQIIDMVNKVKAQKRKVIISLGGQFFHLTMKTEQDKVNFVNQVEKIVDKYGFEGIDLDLEGSATSADTTLLAQAVNEVVSHYRNQGKDFLLTMAPEWSYITPVRYGCGQWGSGAYENTFYTELATKIGMENISYVMPQTYNQGPANGICGANETKVSPSEGGGMPSFVAAMTWALTTESGYAANTKGNTGTLMPRIPSNKFLVGVPAALGAAGGYMAYQLSPTEIASSWSIMQKTYGITAGGFMSWSADWDATPYTNTNFNYKHVAWETGKAIYETINNASPSPTPPAPEQCTVNTTYDQDKDCFCSFHATDSKCSVTPEPDPAPASAQGIVGYYQSWSADWKGDAASHSLSQIPGYVSRVLISFVQPSCQHTAGKADCGLNFSSDFSVVKGAIALAHKNNPNQKFLLSVGGATYPFPATFTAENAKNLVALMNDLGADGIDIDYENVPSCTGVDTAALSCSTDSQLVNIINTVKSALPVGKMLTAATWSVGAYGSEKFPTTTYGPKSAYTGLFVNPLKQAGSKFDEIYIMSYDAGNKQTTGYDPKQALTAYAALFPMKNTYLGLEVPNEAWGGNVLTVADALDYALHAKSQGAGGVMLWSLNKVSNVNGENANDYLKPICNAYGLANCSQNIPLK